MAKCQFSKSASVLRGLSFERRVSSGELGDGEFGQAFVELFHALRLAKLAAATTACEWANNHAVLLALALGKLCTRMAQRVDRFGDDDVARRLYLTKVFGESRTDAFLAMRCDTLDETRTALATLFGVSAEELSIVMALFCMAAPWLESAAKRGKVASDFGELWDAVRRML